MLLYLVFLGKYLYDYIYLIYVTLSHGFLSRTVQYLLSYMQITSPALKIVRFWKKITRLQ